MRSCPRHVSIILDGNGRWAETRNRPRTFGHYQGVKALGPVIRAAADLGVAYLSVFAFSTENWQRSSEEVGYLWRLPSRFFKQALTLFMEKNVRFVHVGFQKGLPPAALRIFNRLTDQTAENKGMVFALVMNYGGRQDIEQAAAKQTGKPFKENLVAGILPDVDLLIRTGGEMRISNYLLWHCAYAELLFTDVLWPDYTPEHLMDNVRAYQQRERRFGTIKKVGPKG